MPSCSPFLCNNMVLPISGQHGPIVCKKDSAILFLYSKQYYELCLFVLTTLLFSHIIFFTYIVGLRWRIQLLACIVSAHPKCSHLRNEIVETHSVLCTGLWFLNQMLVFRFILTWSVNPSTQRRDRQRGKTEKNRDFGCNLVPTYEH